MQLHFKKSATACNYSFRPSWNFPNATAALQIAVKTALLGGFKQTEHNYLQHAKKTDDCSGSTVWSSVHTPTICGKSKDQRQFASQPRPAQWQFLDRMSKCGFDSLWRTVLRLRYGKGFSFFLIWRVLIICHFATQAATPVQCYVLDLILPSKPSQ